MQLPAYLQGGNMVVVASQSESDFAPARARRHKKNAMFTTLNRDSAISAMASSEHKVREVADDGEPAGDYPKVHAVTDNKPGQCNRGIGHVKVATSTDNLTVKTPP
jgi:hypothetical protein